MLKKIGISMAALCAALVLAKPPAAAAADRDDYHYRPSYQYNQGRRGYQTYTPQQRFRNDYWFQNEYRNDRRDREWRENQWRQRDRREQRQRWNYRDRDDDYYRYQAVNAGQTKSLTLTCSGSVIQPSNRACRRPRDLVQPKPGTKTGVRAGAILGCPTNLLKC